MITSTPSIRNSAAPRSRWLALALLAAVSGALSAQPAPPDGPGGGPGGPGGGPEGGISPERLVEKLRDPAIRAELKISDDQMTRLDTLSYQTEKTMIDLKGERQLVHLDLKRLLNSDRFDSTAATALADKLVAVEGRMMRARLMALFETRRIFSDEQWRKLHAMAGQRLMERMKEGRQGQGRPGGNRRMRGGGGPDGMDDQRPPPPPGE